MKMLREGDTGLALTLAPGRGRVRVVYKYQDLVLDSGTVVKDVLVMARRRNPENVLPLRPRPFLLLWCCSRRDRSTATQSSRAVARMGEAPYCSLPSRSLMPAVGVLAALCPARRGIKIQPTDALTSDG